MLRSGTINLKMMLRNISKIFIFFKISLSIKIYLGVEISEISEKYNLEISEKWCYSIFGKFEKIWLTESEPGKGRLSIFGNFLQKSKKVNGCLTIFGKKLGGCQTKYGRLAGVNVYDEIEIFYFFFHNFLKNWIK